MNNDEQSRRTPRRRRQAKGFWERTVGDNIEHQPAADFIRHYMAGGEKSKQNAESIHPNHEKQ